MCACNAFCLLLSSGILSQKVTFNLPIVFFLFFRISLLHYCDLQERERPILGYRFILFLFIWASRFIRPMQKENSQVFNWQKCWIVFIKIRHTKRYFYCLPEFCMEYIVDMNSMSMNFPIEPNIRLYISFSSWKKTNRKISYVAFIFAPVYRSRVLAWHLIWRNIGYITVCDTFRLSHCL